MDEHPLAGGCGPRLLNADNSLQPSCHPTFTPQREFWRLMFLDRLWHRATYTQERWAWDTSRTVEVIKGACFLVRRSALEQVGLLVGSRCEPQIVLTHLVQEETWERQS